MWDDEPVDWIALLQVAGPIALGLAGIAGTLWGSLAEGRRAERLARRQILTPSLASPKSSKQRAMSPVRRPTP